MKVKSGLKEEYADYVKKNHDPYGKCIVDWGEKFGILLETERTDFKEMIDEAAKGLGGPTGFMYGCLISAIAHFHPRGEEVRRWSNLDLQIKDEGEKANKSGGVLNPALVTIELPNN